MTIEQFRQICDDWKQSGLSVQQYCENIGLTESRFYYWRAKIHAEFLPSSSTDMRKSYVGHTALTELTIGQFADHLSFYRQIAMFKRLGIVLKKPTTEGWFFGIADLMCPMYYRLQEYILQLDNLQSDESTVPVVNNEKPHRQGHRIFAGTYPSTLTVFH